MRNLVRLLIMFGPMILQQIQRSQRKKAKYDRWETPDNNRNHNRRRNNRQRPPEVIDIEPKKTPAEENMDLKEEDIMLNKEDLKYVDGHEKIDVEEIE